MKKIILFLGLLVVLVIAIIIAKPSIIQRHTTTQKIAQVVATYTGMLPCADCSGIKTTLKLYSDKSYREEDVYIGRDVTNIEKGIWSIMQGTVNGKDSIIYVFTASGSANKSYYLSENNKIELLDKDMKKIDSPFNLSLTKE